MQNPFTTIFSKNPENSYIYTDRTKEILENFYYDNPSESVYKITGVRGSGKTEYVKKGWLVFDINPSRDLLIQIASMLVKEGFGKKTTKGKSLSISASFLGTGGSVGFSSEKDNAFFDIGILYDLLYASSSNAVSVSFFGSCCF